MRRAVWAALGAATVLAAFAAVVLWRDAEAAESSLLRAREALRDGEVALTDAHDGVAATTAFARAQQAVTDARERVDGLAWTAVGAMPRVGGSVELVRAATELAGTSADLGAEVAAQADRLLDGALEGVMEGGRLDLQRLDELAATVDALPVDAVVDARERLASVPADRVVASLLDEREGALAQVDTLLTRLDRAETGLDAARAFLGTDGPRTYLVAAQNPAELRGTGGLIGFMTELSIRDGEISLSAGVSIDTEQELIQRSDVDSSLELPDPVERPAAFAERYDHIAGGSFFASVNADPHLPMVGPVLLDLYEQEVGPQLDGVIMVDPVALGTIVQTTGQPLELPADLDTAELPHRIPGDQLARTVMVDGYDAFEGGGPAKKAFDRAVITAGFDRLTTGGWDPVAMGQTLGEVFATRHLQVFSRDEDEQAAFELLGLAGGMAPTDQLADVLAVTGINAAANKLDVHVAHRISGQLELGPVRDSAPGTAIRTGTLRVAVENPLRPDDHNPYITSSQDPREIGSPGGGYEVDALNRTWFSIWTPPLTEVRALREGGEEQMFRATNIHDHRVFDYFLETPSASTNSFEVDLEGRVELARDGEAMVYELALWRQAKAIPDHWDLTVLPPPGWQVDTASAEGGGAPTGMGVGGDAGERIEASVEDGAVRLVGAVTRDATLQVRLVRD